MAGLGVFTLASLAYVTAVALQSNPGAEPDYQAVWFNGALLVLGVVLSALVGKLIGLTFATLRFRATCRALLVRLSAHRPDSCRRPPPHLLLVGVPGLGKSRLVETLGIVLGIATKRIPFTPDLMPADIRDAESDRAGGHLPVGRAQLDRFLLEVNVTYPRAGCRTDHAPGEHRGAGGPSHQGHDR